MSDYDIKLFMMCLQTIHLPSHNVTNVTETPSFMDTLSPEQESWTNEYDSFTYNNEEYERMRTIVHKVTPIICVFGTIGNLLNLMIFTRRFYTGKVNQIEKGAIIGLASLAASDLAFCLLIITGSLIPNHKTLFTKKDFSYVYQVYGLVLQNALMKISTWLTTIACMSRYAAVCYPLWARQFIRLTHIKISVLLSFVLPCLLYIPQLWTHTVHEMHCTNYTLYILSTGYFEENVALHQTFNYVWLILGYIVPTAIMMYCNYGLIVSFRQSMSLRTQMRNMQTDSVSIPEPRMSYSAGNAHLIVRDGRTEVKQCAGSQAKDRITITLITVVVLYIILISPSEILNFYSTISVPGENNRAYHTALVSILARKYIYCVSVALLSNKIVFHNIETYLVMFA